MLIVYIAISAIIAGCILSLALITELSLVHYARSQTSSILSSVAPHGWWICAWVGIALMLGAVWPIGLIVCGYRMFQDRRRSNDEDDYYVEDERDF